MTPHLPSAPRTGPSVRTAFVPLLAACLLFGGCRGGATAPAPGPFEGRLSGSPFDADIRALGEADFVRRSQAAERLVAVGAASLPALGAAGDRVSPAPGSPAESTTAPVVAAIFARLSEAEAEALLASPHALLREAAAREIGRRGAWTPVPALIERLSDPDLAVRLAAHGALRRITGELSDPTPAGTARSGAAERWRQWWSQEGRARALAVDDARGG